MNAAVANPKNNRHAIETAITILYTRESWFCTIHSPSGLCWCGFILSKHFTRAQRRWNTSHLLSKPPFTETNVRKNDNLA
jgi:hypothetical protein